MSNLLNFMMGAEWLNIVASNTDVPAVQDAAETALKVGELGGLSLGVQTMFGKGLFER